MASWPSARMNFLVAYPHIFSQSSLPKNTRSKSLSRRSRKRIKSKYRKRAPTSTMSMMVMLQLWHILCASIRGHWQPSLKSSSASLRKHFSKWIMVRQGKRVILRAVPFNSQWQVRQIRAWSSFWISRIRMSSWLIPEVTVCTATKSSMISTSWVQLASHMAGSTGTITFRLFADSKT